MHLEHALLEVVLSHSNEGIHMVDTAGITRYYNRAAATMDGLEPEEVLGKHVLEVFPSLDKGTSTLLKVARTGKPIVDQQQVYTNFRSGNLQRQYHSAHFGQRGLLGLWKWPRIFPGPESWQNRSSTCGAGFTAKILPLRESKGRVPLQRYNRREPDTARGPDPRALAAHTESPVMVIGRRERARNYCAINTQCQHAQSQALYCSKLRRFARKPSRCHIIWQR